MIGNWWAIMQRTKLLNSLIAGYEQVAVVFPIIVAAPRYFSGQIQLGGLTQTAGAFGRVQDSLSWFVTRLLLARLLARDRRASDHVPPGDRRRTRGGSAKGIGLADTGTKRSRCATSTLDSAERRESASER